MTERARLYLYYIVGQVEKRGMPTEIALLPMIESAFNPTAYSVANASGIWQFIPSTGKHFGLEQNWWHDERRDVISATTGAGAPSYTSGVHTWKGTEATLKPSPTNISAMPAYAGVGAPECSAAAMAYTLVEPVAPNIRAMP